PAAHASAPAAVSALLSALVVKAPLVILWMLWSQIAPPELASRVGPAFAVAGLMALVFGGLSAMRTPYLKVLVAYSTVAQLGYALMALGLLLAWQLPEMNSALWLFIIAHRSEEHTSELQSRENLVCRLLLEKKNNQRISINH